MKKLTQRILGTNGIAVVEIIVIIAVIVLFIVVGIPLIIGKNDEPQSAAMVEQQQPPTPTPEQQEQADINAKVVAVQAQKMIVEMEVMGAELDEIETALTEQAVRQALGFDDMIVTFDKVPINSMGDTTETADDPFVSIIVDNVTITDSQGIVGKWNRQAG